jgi:subtilisin family serine protease
MGCFVAFNLFSTYYIGSNWGRCIDLYAPGALIRSAWAGSTNDVENILSGTSMSSGFVSGTVALYLEREPLTLPHTIRYYLLSDALIGVLKSGPNIANFLELLFNPTPNILLNLQNLFIASSMEPSSSPTTSPTTTLRQFSDNDGSASKALMPMNSSNNPPPVNSQEQYSATTTTTTWFAGLITFLTLLFHSSSTLS